MTGLERVYVHIGPPKTGTTFLQLVLGANVDPLAADGGTVGARQHFAGRQLRRRDDPTGRPSRPDGWDKLVRVMGRSGRPIGIVSSEGWSRATPAHVADLLASVAPAEVHVVYGVRDLARLVTAGWQTRLRNGLAPTWQQWLGALRDTARGDRVSGDPAVGGSAEGGSAAAEPGAGSPHGGRFWHEQDPRSALVSWTEHVPPERVHVVTVPRGADPGVLWTRFAGVVGLSADRYDLDVPRANTSLGGVEAEVLHRLTAQVAPRLPTRAYNDIVRRFIAREVLERRPQSFRLVLPAAEHAWLDPVSWDIVAHLRESAYDVVGELADIEPVVEDADRDPDDVSAQEVAALSGEVLAALVHEAARRGVRTAPGRRRRRHGAPGGRT